jgi:hypothetical protein
MTGYFLASDPCSMPLCTPVIIKLNELTITHTVYCGLMLIRPSFHNHIDSKLPKSGPTLPVYQCKGAPIRLSTAYEGAQTLFIFQYGCGKQLVVV